MDATETYYSVFATHLQAWTANSAPGNGVAIREYQAEQFAQFIASQSIPTTEAVLLAGDFNMDKTGSELEPALRTLAAKLPRTVGTIQGTHSDDNLTRINTDTKKWLDYVVYSTRHRRPTSATMQAIALTPASAFEACTGSAWSHSVAPHSAGCATTEKVNALSDHLPVIGRFEFSGPSSSGSSH